MKERLSTWQGVLIGSLITPICLRLQYPLNLGVMVLVIVGLLVYVIKDRKEYNKFNFAGITSAIIGSIVIAISTTGQTMQGVSFGTQILSSLGLLFMGIILIGIGNHIRTPEKVSKKQLMYGSGILFIFFGGFWVLLNCF
ncbi:phage holin family protein [Pelosinus sp. UFO1]|uniref:phage holin family protein n=1 Tax=Pelosinus sp. UFO1 TaxID=484770 RepID=UPI0004D0F876|nr:phage holin family protein [Pelosinus sp. UFO1]AIF49787.1 membrane protein of unknown function [Pelosinus sp. UFO1]